MGKGEIGLLKLVMGILLLVGIVSMVYYVMIVSYAGLHSSFTWFWPIVGLACFGFFFLLIYIMKQQIVIAVPLKIAVITVVLICSLGFLLLESIIIYHGNVQPEANAEYMIILGAKVRGTQLTRALKKRLDTAVVYLKENKETMVIVSGGQGNGEDISEAEAMKTYLITMGIEESRIIEEKQSTNTNENIQFSKEFIEGSDNRVVIVSNDFHIFRATRIAKKQDIGDVQGLGAPTGDILFISYYIREAFAVIKDKLVGNF